MSESAAAAETAADADSTAAPAAAQDLYAVLGCAKGDDAPVITRKYRKLALKYHPDRNRGEGQEEAAEKFRAVSDEAPAAPALSARKGRKECVRGENKLR